MKQPPKRTATDSQSITDSADSLRLVKLMADSLSQGLIIYEKSPTRIVYANPAAERIIGYESKELRSMTQDSLRKILVEEDLGKIRQFLNVTHIEKHDPPTLEHRFIRSDGTTIWIETTRTEVKYGEREFSVFLFSDVTAKKVQEHEVISREERYRLLYENLADALFITDTNGNITMCNSQGTNLFGYSEQEFIGMNFTHLIHPDEREHVIDAFRTSIESGRTREEGMIARGIRKDGKSFYYHVTSTLITKDGAPMGFQSLLRDVTDRKLSEIKLRNSIKDLELYSSFLKHDIRHELQIIATSSGILSEVESPTMSPKSTSEIITDSVDRINNILNFMDTSDVTPSTGDIIDDLEKNALQAMRTHENLSIVLEVNPTVKDIPLPRGALIGLVFSNLFRNAAIHGGGTVNMRVQVQMKDDSLIIDFIDDGKGIAEDIQASLFKKGASTQGRGLGLYLSKRVIEEYNGTIDYNDRKGEGACFRIVLPVEI